jgi:hypothetical protein
MQTRTIANSSWRTFFDSFSRLYSGSSASLEILTDDLGAQYEIEETPLRGISYDVSGLELHFATREGHLVHRIEKPERIEVEENDEGLITAVEIAPKDEPRVVLHLSAPLASHLLTA